MDSLGKRIVYLRESKGIKQRQLMDMLNFNNLSRFEKDEMKPGIDIVISLASFFNVSLDWLLTGKEFSDVNIHRFEKELIDKLSRLSERNQAKVEGIIEGLLMSQSDEKGSSYPSRTTGEEAAGMETA